MDNKEFSTIPITIPKQIICVLGMHRSGTSCLTGSLQAGGLFLGKHHTWNKHNVKGNRENQDVVDLHDDLLMTNGGSWDNPPKKTIWQPRHYQRAQEILAEYADVPIWGFKDPRALLLIEGWRQLVPSMQFVGIYRHPLAVVQSLHNRGQFCRERALQLWASYNSRLLEVYKKNPFPVLSFDVDEAKFNDLLIALHAQLGLAPLSESERFYSAELRNCQDFTNEKLPWRVTRLYNRLQKIGLR